MVVFHVQLKAVQVSDGLSDTEGETVARGVMRLPAIEPPEDSFAILRRNATPGVAHDQPRQALDGPRFDPHFASCGGKFDRIVDEIRNDLAPQIYVAAHGHGMARLN